MTVFDENLSRGMSKDQVTELKKQEKELTKAFEKSRAALAMRRDSTFVCTLLFNLRTYFSFRVPTAGTDGVCLYVNPNFFMNLNEEQRIFLLAHETWHVAFSHMLRGGKEGINFEVYNAAADYVINLLLVDNGHEFIPGGLLDEKYRGLSTEEVYELLIDNPPPEVQSHTLAGDVMEPGSGDDSKEGDDGSSDEKGDEPSEGKTKSEAQIQEDIDEIVMRSAIQSEMAGEDPGSLPGDVVRRLDELRNPRLDWKTLFQNYMTSFAKEDYSYARPNKRFMPTHYMPAMYSESLGEIAFAIDASGSVTPEEFTAYLNEIRFIKESMQPELLTIIDFDYEVQDRYNIPKDEPWDDEISFTGGGGTNLQPVFDLYNEEPPMVLVVFSDLHCRKMTEDPGYPVLWIAVNNPNAEVNFGEIIHIDV